MDAVRVNDLDPPNPQHKNEEGWEEYYPVSRQCSMPSKMTNQHVFQHQSGISPKEYNLKNTVPRCRSNQELEGEVQEEASPVWLQPDRTHQCPQKGK